MVCKCLDKSEARGKHSKALLLCLVEAEMTAKLSGWRISFIYGLLQSAHLSYT